eukprot:CAMPEP_0183508746 /NCGR_PEP_ID=MMETSP0371-20130417/9087_1 /TAXON_ID=268820 /ORGANISM="Peridinium aciculiferum, Strain PAER-2" /LENGTH=145 /DNA_ID=CAMNT_0025705189 /DNA_START=20 /DNA_END=454 /DNA_ORIENTATION=-
MLERAVASLVHIVGTEAIVELAAARIPKTAKGQDSWPSLSWTGPETVVMTRRNGRLAPGKSREATRPDVSGGLEYTDDWQEGSWWQSSGGAHQTWDTDQDVDPHAGSSWTGTPASNGATGGAGDDDEEDEDWGGWKAEPESASAA